MKEQFKEVRFHSKSLALIYKCNEIVEDYQGQGLRLTLRQLYYQLVSRNVIPNVEKSYKNLSSLVSDARLSGRMDWAAIEDRVRVPKRPSEWNNLAELAEGALRAYRLPRWEGQKFYVELWVEKDALAGVLQPLAWEYHVTMMVNRGYSSQSAMYDAGNRFSREGRGKSCVLLYLGDFDPSGEDMVRDIGERLEMFGANVKVEKIALTMAQIKKYNPPPNPAKLSDPRAVKYMAEHGDSSWEVDALPPEVLAEVIRGAIKPLVNVAKMNEVKRKEEEDKDLLRDAVSNL